MTEPAPTLDPIALGPAPTLLGANLRPEADLRREYLASGGASFPLSGQVVLSQSIDDLTRDLGTRVYDMMLTDPTVASGYGTIVTGVLAGEFQVLPTHVAAEGEEVEEGSERAAEIADALWATEFCQRQLARLNRPVKQVCAEFLLAMAYGTKLAEKVFEPGDGEDAGLLVLKTLRFKRNASWAFTVDPFGDVVAIRGMVVGGGISDLPPAKFMVFSWLPTDGDPRGHSILRPAYNGWNLKINTWPKFFKYLDLFGMPTKVGIVGPDAPDEPARDERGNETSETWNPSQAMLYALQKIDGGACAALPPGSKIEFLQAVGNGEAFHAAFTLFKHEILEGILLTAQTVMEAQRNSQAQAESASDVVGQLLVFGREGLENLYEDQLFHPLLELNRGKAFADRYTPEVSLGQVEQADVAAMLASFSAAGWAPDQSHYPIIDAMVGLPARKVVTEAPIDDAAPGQTEQP